MGSRLPGPRGPIAQAKVAAGLQRHPTDTIVDLHERYGPVAAFGVRPFRVVALFGADANKFVLADRTDAFRVVAKN